MRRLLQAAVDSTQYKLGYKIGVWIPFILLGIALTVMILVIRKKNKGN
jgi:hypothetical protein